MIHPGVVFFAIATSYCDVGATKTGPLAAPGIVAVDPRVIPLRSRLRVFVRDATDRLGHLMHIRFRRTIFRADDTGGLVRGRHIDIWMPSCSDSITWGRRLVQVEIAPAAGLASR